MITKDYNSLCQEAKPYYYDCLCDQSNGLIPESISSHIEQCLHCQKQIKQLEVALSQKECLESKNRQNTTAVTEMLQLHFAYIGERVTCETVRPFLPGLLDPAMEIRIPTPITVHLDNCQQCTEDLNEIRKLNLHSPQLHRLSQLFTVELSWNTTELSEMSPAVSAMAQRANFDIITIYHIDESAKNRQTDDSDDLYSGFPIRVDVLDPKEDVEQPVSNLDFAPLKEKVTPINLKSFLKIGLPVAAVLLIGFALLLNTTSAKAFTKEQFFKVLESVKSVYISTYSADADGNKLIQESWISDSSDIYMTKTEKEFVWCDINTGLQKIKNYDTSEIDIIQLNKEARAYIKQRISGSIGLTPIYDKSENPRDSEWLLMNDKIPEAVEGIDIYDLNWTKKTTRSYVLKRWRFFVDSKTFLPKKIEIYGTEIGQSDYILKMVTSIESTSDIDIQTVIDDAGF
ncbi:MAG: hypothetical protein GY774_03140 [Planctomycetes bacterium]|nr:hypothetical protein [Planctomycetota bacterium]